MRRDKPERPENQKSEERENRLRMPDNYWTRIADDAAHGYGADANGKKSMRTRLNEDQLPGDNERG